MPETQRQDCLDRTADDYEVYNSKRREATGEKTRTDLGTISGLAGYVGVDLILTPSSPIVVKVDPRLTAVYVGLTEALDINVAASLGVFDPVLAPAPWAIGTGMKTVEASTAYHPVMTPHP